MIDLALPPDPSVLSDARLAIGELAADVPPAMLDDLRLIVSELITNSLRHSGAEATEPIEVTVETTRSMVRGDVTDRGDGFEIEEPTQSMHQESGWGLFLVRQLATRWGVRTKAGRTTVWFELDL